MPGIASGPRAGSSSPSGVASGTPRGSSSGWSGGRPLGASSEAIVGKRTILRRYPRGPARIPPGRRADRRAGGSDVPNTLARMARVITFLSDYGHDDDFVGVCHGVIARIAPDARVLDVTHGIPRHDVRSGALVLRRALPFFPAGVHVAVVDPEVGAERRGIAVRTGEEDRVLVGPDNGLLLPAAKRFGGVVEAIEISRSKHRLEPT